jgi:hypothetical protein
MFVVMQGGCSHMRYRQYNNENTLLCMGERSILYCATPFNLHSAFILYEPNRVLWQANSEDAKEDTSN